MKFSLFSYSYIFLFIVFIICIIYFSTLLNIFSINSENFLIENDIIISDFSINNYITNELVWPTPGYNYITSGFGYRVSPTTGARSLSLWY